MRIPRLIRIFRIFLYHKTTSKLIPQEREAEHTTKTQTPTLTNPHHQTHNYNRMSSSLKQKYQLCEQIGRGQFGTVHRCFNLSTGENYACKTITKSHLSNDLLDLQSLHNEPKSLLHLSNSSSPHPNIVFLHDLFEDDDHLHLILDLCDSSLDLYTLLTTAGPLPESQSSQLLASIVKALSHCHKLGICHRDVKPENVLFGFDGEVKLADFGSAEWFGDGRLMRGVVGTPYYVAPEVLLGREYNEKVDVWSAGVILYVMLAGFPPFYGENASEIFEAVVRGNLRFPTRVFRGVSGGAKDLLRKMLCRDVSRRFSADQVLRHPWIVNGGMREEDAD